MYENGEQIGMVFPPEYYKSVQIQSTRRDVYHPSIQAIGGLLSSCNLRNCFHGPYIGYLEDKKYSLSRNELLFDEPLMNCLRAWTKKKYRQNYYKMIKDWHLVLFIQKMIEFCDLEDAIVKENEKHLYSTMRSKIELGTIKGLIQIHKYLFVGVRINEGDLNTAAGGINLIDLLKDKIAALFDSPLSGKEFDIELNRAGIFDEKRRAHFRMLMDVNYLPTSEYKEIIYKYLALYGAEPFYYGNNKALEI